MNNPPGGKITFLFTDIEGSTKLAQEFPESLQSSLDIHNTIMHKVIESNNGFVFEIVGDAFCCAFEKAEDAVMAAVDAQLGLANEKWKDAVIKIRIGIHSGNAEWKDNRYNGYITLARTARVMSAAYGEQIIITCDTYQLSKEKLPEGISIRDLGERRLKDLKQPVRLYQIIADRLVSDFPPLKTLDARPNNLPVQLTSFIGREEEMKLIKTSLKQTCLLTLTGPGGTGKTRLALQVAADVIDDFTNGVWFVGLDSLHEPELLPHTIMQALGICEQSKQDVRVTLSNYMKDKELLIALDNCEHLIEACAELTEKLLLSSPKLKVLATSREALRCSGELTHNTLPLLIPDPKDKESPEQLMKYTSVKLFNERALSVNPDFKINNDNAHSLTEICYKLDGIPLAIELASARTKILSLDKINEKLDDIFNLLTGGKRTALPRQQTLLAAIDWSYDLLSEKEKTLWNRLTVFSGGWTLEAAEEICSDEILRKTEVVDLLTGLSEKSIIIFNTEAERFRMLETIRQYGNDKLKESNEKIIISDRHLKYYIKITEAADQKIYGPEIITALKELDIENGNVEKGLTWTKESNNDQEGSQLAGAMGHYWQIRGRNSEAISWFENILKDKPEINNSCSCDVMYWLGVFFYYKNEYKRSGKFLEQSKDFYRENDDKRGIAKSLNYLGLIAAVQGEYLKASGLHEESLEIFREINDKHGISDSLLNLGTVCSSMGQYARANDLLEESLGISREFGNKPGIGKTIIRLGMLAFERGEYLKASELFKECLMIFKEIGDKSSISASLMNLGSIAFLEGKNLRASELFKESLALSREIGNKSNIARNLGNLGHVEYAEESYPRAYELCEESLAIRRELGDKNGIAYSLMALAQISYSKKEFEPALKLFQDSLIISREIGNYAAINACLQSLGNISLKTKDYKQAGEYFNESLILNRESGNKGAIVNNINGFAELHIIYGSYDRAAKLLGFTEVFNDSYKNVLVLSDKDNFEKLILMLKEKLNEEEYLKYFEAGKKLTLEEAVQLIVDS